jgi:hypothetical protein
MRSQSEADLVCGVGQERSRQRAFGAAEILHQEQFEDGSTSVVVENDFGSSSNSSIRGIITSNLEATFRFLSQECNQRRVRPGGCQEFVSMTQEPQGDDERPPSGTDGRKPHGDYGFIEKGVHVAGRKRTAKIGDVHGRRLGRSFPRSRVHRQRRGEISRRNTGPQSATCPELERARGPHTLAFTKRSLQEKPWNALERWASTSRNRDRTRSRCSSLRLLECGK